MKTCTLPADRPKTARQRLPAGLGWARLAPALGLAALSLLLVGCPVSRMSRPNLVGYVYDAETRQPLEGCRVGDEAVTDERGYFELPETRYLDFTWIAMEAPPVMIQERVSKEGYEDFVLEIFDLYGGGAAKGTRLEVEPIYLQPVAVP